MIWLRILENSLTIRFCRSDLVEWVRKYYKISAPKLNFWGHNDCLLLGNNIWPSNVLRHSSLMLWCVGQVKPTSLRLGVALARIPVVWTIHNVYEKLFSLKEKLALLVSAYLSSRVPYKIVCCSDAVADVYARHHRYANNKLIVIPAGVDTSKFKPDSAACQSMKSELNLDDKTIVITIAGGFRPNRPDKDFASFIKAAGIVHEQYPNIKYLMCGYGLNWHNPRLVSWIKDSGIERVTQLLGPRDDLHRILAATDIIVSSSQFEAFGLTIFEGMASGAVPVCTDTGEMPKGARDIGRVVPTGDPRMLANAMCELIELDRNERALLSAKAVARVAEQYSIRITAEHYSSLFKEIVAQH